MIIIVIILLLYTWILKRFCGFGLRNITAPIKQKSELERFFAVNVTINFKQGGPIITIIISFILKESLTVTAFRCVFANR